MAVAAYYTWLNAGKPLTPARPIREIVERMRAAYPAVKTFGWWANDAHYQAVPAEDHTPFSQTGWPLASPQWWVFATDVMHTPALGVDCNKLFAYWIGEARAGRMPWLKYLNWQGKQYRAKGYGGETVAFRTAWANSGHFDHIHLSIRTDHRDTSLGSWSLLPTTQPQQEDDMALTDMDARYLVDRVRCEADMADSVTTDHGEVITHQGVIAFKALIATVAAIASKVDIDPAELEAIKQAAGAGVAAQIPALVDALMTRLPADTLSRDEMAQVIRDVLAPGFVLAPDTAS